MTSYNDGIYAQGNPDQSVTEIALDALITEGWTEGSIADRQYNQLTSRTMGLHLDGTIDTYASTGDKASLDITGDIDIRVRVAPDDWASGAQQTLVAKWDGLSQRSYLLRILATGEILFAWTTEGTSGTQNLRTSSDATGFATGAEHWLRVTLDVDNGASGHDVVFETSDDGETWTELDAQTNAGTTSIHAGTTDLQVGATQNGTFLAGVVGYAEVRDGIGGTIVADPDFSAQEVNTESFNDSSGSTWTVQGNAVIKRNSGNSVSDMHRKLNPLEPVYSVLDPTVV